MSDGSLLLTLAGSAILILVGAISWIARRWIEMRTEREKFLAEKISYTESKATSTKTEFDVYRSMTDDRLRDGSVKIRDFDSRIDYIEKTKLGNIEFQAFLDHHKIEQEKNNADHDAIRTAIGDLKDSLADIHGKFESTTQRAEGAVRALSDVAAKLVVLGERK